MQQYCLMEKMHTSDRWDHHSGCTDARVLRGGKITLYRAEMWLPHNARLRDAWFRCFGFTLANRNLSMSCGIY